MFNKDRLRLVDDKMSPEQLEEEERKRLIASITEMLPSLSIEELKRVEAETTFGPLLEASCKPKK